MLRFNSIHPRYKRQIVDRLTLAGFVVAYGLSDVGIYQGPIAKAIDVGISAVRLEYGAALEIRRYQTWSGFEASRINAISFGVKIRILFFFGNFTVEVSTHAASPC
jgi:hypothetical protein